MARMDERTVSRRGRRTYLPERIPARVDDQRRRETPPPRAEQLVAAAKMSSALRRGLKANGIDQRMARLVLCFYGRALLRPRELAWQLGLSRSTASRWLDRAESIGLVDKFYDTAIDRRATDARLTERGHALRVRVERVLASCAPDDRRYGVAYGRRAAPPLDG